MEREGLTFQETAADARKLGYVEADESLDLDGWDTAHKAVILAYLAHGTWIPLKDVPVKGIRRISLEDIQWANDLGYKIKLLGIITRDVRTAKIFVRIHPTLVPKRKILASVDEVYNGISVTGDIVGTTVHIGRGAGQDATASAVISDVSDAVAALLGTAAPAATMDLGGKPRDEAAATLELASLSEVSGQYYVRLKVTDKPGVLAEVATEMARHDVSIASVIQPKAKKGKSVTLILTTHTSNEKSIQDTIRDLKNLKSVLKTPFLLRIADFDD
jgi:homoserine dehydrogenase